MKPILLVLAFTAFATSIRADEFLVQGSALFSSPTGPVETVGTSFNYDSASLSVSNMSFEPQGLIGSNFTFAGVADNSGTTVFQWSGPEAIFTADFPDSKFAEAISAASTYKYAEVGDNIFLRCLTSACTSDFPGGQIESAFSEVSAVPEPSSLSLLALGLVGGGFLLWRKRELLSNEHTSVTDAEHRIPSEV